MLQFYNLIRPHHSQFGDYMSHVVEWCLSHVRVDCEKDKPNQSIINSFNLIKVFKLVYHLVELKNIRPTIMLLCLDNDFKNKSIMACYSYWG